MRIGAIPEGVIERLAKLAGIVPIPFIETFHAVIVARSVTVATKLGVFDGFGAGPRTASELAAQLGVHSGALERLLNLMVTTGYLRYRRGHYSPSRMGRKWLSGESRQSLRDNLLFRFLEWQVIENTEEFVRTGKALDAHNLIQGEQWSVYQRGMRSLARLSAREVVQRVHLADKPADMLDIGGGHGTYSAAFCRRYAGLRATVLDLPEAIAAAAPILAEEQLGDRVIHRVGNALTEDLGTAAWDFILISQLVHHFDEPTNRALVARAASALRPRGTLAIIDVFRQPSPNDNNQNGAILDLYFGLTSNAGTWPASAVVAWFLEAGLKPGKTIGLRMAPGISIATAHAGNG